MNDTMKQAMDCALYAYKKERSAQCGEGFTREMYDELAREVPVEIDEERVAMQCAFDAAFATGAVGMYEKIRGIPKPIPERIITWIEGTIAQIEMLKHEEHTVSKRMLLTQLYSMASSAQAAINEVRAYNANIKP